MPLRDGWMARKWWRKPTPKKSKVLAPKTTRPVRLPWRRRPVTPVAAAPVAASPAPTPIPFRRRPVEPMVPVPEMTLAAPSPWGRPAGVSAFPGSEQQVPTTLPQYGEREREILRGFRPELPELPGSRWAERTLRRFGPIEAGERMLSQMGKAVEREPSLGAAMQFVGAPLEYPAMATKELFGKHVAQPLGITPPALKAPIDRMTEAQLVEADQRMSTAGFQMEAPPWLTQNFYRLQVYNEATPEKNVSEIAHQRYPEQAKEILGHLSLMAYSPKHNQIEAIHRLAHGENPESVLRGSQDPTNYESYVRGIAAMYGDEVANKTMEEVRRTGRVPSASDMIYEFAGEILLDPLNVIGAAMKGDDTALTAVRSQYGDKVADSIRAGWDEVGRLMADETGAMRLSRKVVKGTTRLVDETGKLWLSSAVADDTYDTARVVAERFLATEDIVEKQRYADELTDILAGLAKEDAQEIMLELGTQALSTVPKRKFTWSAGAAQVYYDGSPSLDLVATLKVHGDEIDNILLHPVPIEELSNARYSPTTQTQNLVDVMTYRLREIAAEPGVSDETLDLIAAIARDEFAYTPEQIDELAELMGSSGFTRRAKYQRGLKGEGRGERWDRRPTDVPGGLDEAAKRGETILGEEFTGVIPGGSRITKEVFGGQSIETIPAGWVDADVVKARVRVQAEMLENWKFPHGAKASEVIKPGDGSFVIEITAPASKQIIDHVVFDTSAGARAFKRDFDVEQAARMSLRAIGRTVPEGATRATAKGSKQYKGYYELAFKNSDVVYTYKTWDEAIEAQRQATKIIRTGGDRALIVKAAARDITHDEQLLKAVEAQRSRVAGAAVAAPLTAWAGRPPEPTSSLPWQRRPVLPMPPPTHFQRRPVKPLAPTVPTFEPSLRGPTHAPIGVAPAYTPPVAKPPVVRPPVGLAIQQPTYPGEAPPPKVVGEATKSPLFIEVMTERYNRAAKTAGEAKGIWKVFPILGEWGDVLAIPIEMSIGWLADQFVPEEGKEVVADVMAATTARLAAEAGFTEEQATQMEKIQNVAAEATKRYGDTPEVRRAIVWSYSMTWSGSEAQLIAVDRMMAGEDPYVVCEYGHTNFNEGRAAAKGMDDESPEVRASASAIIERYITEDEHAQAHYAYRTEVLGEDQETAYKNIAESGGVGQASNVWQEAGGRILFDPLTYTGLGFVDFLKTRKINTLLAPGATEAAEVLVKGKTGGLLGRTPEFQAAEVKRIASDFTSWAVDTIDPATALSLIEAGEVAPKVGTPAGVAVELLRRIGAGDEAAFEILQALSPVVAEATTSRLGKMATLGLELVSQATEGKKLLISGAESIPELLARGAKNIDDFIGVKPQPKALAWLGEIKGKIAKYLHMGYNPAYAVRNLVGDTSQAIFDRGFNLASRTELDHFFREGLGYVPQAAGKGLGGAASEYATRTGVAGDISNSGHRLVRYLMDNGIDKATATDVATSVSAHGSEFVLEHATDMFANFSDPEAAKAIGVLTRALKKKWANVLIDGPAIELAGKFERFTGERLVYGGAKRYLNKAQNSWFRKNANDLTELPNEITQLLRAGDIDAARDLLRFAPTNLRNKGLILVNDFMENTAEWKLAAGQAGTIVRDFTIHNYSARYGFDTVLGVLFQYPFWTSRTAAKWFVRAIDNPGMLGNTLSLVKAVHEHNAGLVDYERGNIHFNDVLGYHVSVPLLSLVIPYYQMYETYKDPNIEELPFGKYYNMVNQFASANQLVTWGLGLYYLASDDEDAQRVGRKILTPITQAKWLGGLIKAGAAKGVDVAQEVYTWSPRERRKVREQLSKMVANGEITYEEAMLAIRDRSTLWDNAVEQAAGETLLPVIAGLVLATPRVQDEAWKAEVGGLYMMVGNLMDRREAGTITLEEYNNSWDLISERYPWSSVLFEKPLGEKEREDKVQQSLYYYYKDELDGQYRQDRDNIIRETPHDKQQLLELKEQYQEKLDGLQRKYEQYYEEEAEEVIKPPKDEYFLEEKLQKQVYQSVGDARPQKEDYLDKEGNPDYDALDKAFVEFWTNVEKRVDVAAIAEAYNVDEATVMEMLPDEEELTSYWRRNYSIPQAVRQVWEDEILRPTWENYHTAVEAGMDKSDAYEKFIEAAKGITALSLKDKIQSAYPDRWTDEELQAELEGVADFPSVEQATLERKPLEARELSEAGSAFWDFRNLDLPPGYRVENIYEHPLVQIIMDAELRGLATTEQYQTALEWLQNWKVENFDKEDWGTPEDWAKARERNEVYEAELEKAFPDIEFDVLWNEYWELGKAERKVYWKEHPELEESLDFKQQFGAQEENKLWAYYYLRDKKATGKAAAVRYYRPRYSGGGRRGARGEKFYGTTRVPQFTLRAPSPWEGALRGKYRTRETPQLFAPSYRVRPTPWIRAKWGK